MDEILVLTSNMVGWLRGSRLNVAPTPCLCRRFEIIMNAKRRIDSL
jgi:hypothetical protein